mmetsp:Transcript_45534/g.131916  ORF Transcript_45534/g.131916 Transcript_45534/m.131916 type:complete len:229 (+) Transcript_45534:715-1401(+)
MELLPQGVTLHQKGVCSLRGVPPVELRGHVQQVLLLLQELPQSGVVGGLGLQVLLQLLPLQVRVRGRQRRRAAAGAVGACRLHQGLAALQDVSPAGRGVEVEHGAEGLEGELKLGLELAQLVQQRRALPAQVHDLCTGLLLLGARRAGGSAAGGGGLCGRAFAPGLRGLGLRRLRPPPLEALDFRAGVEGLGGRGSRGGLCRRATKLCGPLGIQGALKQLGHRHVPLV